MKLSKKKPTQLDRIESKLDTLLSGATFMRELDNAAPKPEGLQPGDYTDASKETADALTEIAPKWWEDPDRTQHSFIVFTSSKGILNTLIEDKHYLDPATFLARAAVTAKEIGLVPVEPWVSVEDRLPEDSRTVLVRMPNGTPKLAWYIGQYMWFDPSTDCRMYPVKWMEIPE